ncbi:hypothetical protein AM479_000001, partial [Pseudomonas aeruginosa]
MKNLKKLFVRGGSAIAVALHWSSRNPPRPLAGITAV